MTANLPAAPMLYREFSTQAQIDAQYNPSIALADPAAPGKHFVAQSALARASLKQHLDISFGPTVHETLDIFPADAPNAPVFVFIHGGYWRALTSKEFSGVALGLPRRGITTVVVTYGHSAGGHLTAMCLQTEWARDYGLAPDPIKAALCISGIYDIAPLRYSYLQPMIQLDDGVVRRNSPAYTARACATPTWFTWGGAETSEFARQAQSMHAAWGALGNQSELRPIAGADHFTVLAGFERPEGELCAWLAGQLGV